jgi:hypothetical protein
MVKAGCSFKTRSCAHYSSNADLEAQYVHMGQEVNTYVWDRLQT